MRNFEQELNNLNLTMPLTEKQWHAMRLGVVTASKADSFLAKKGTAKRDTYMHELVAEIATNAPAEEVSSAAIRWGLSHEAEARELYAFDRFCKVKEIPFIYKDGSKQFGCSPDGLVYSNHALVKGLEIKCPYTTKYHIQAMGGQIKPEYKAQIQFSMWVTGLEQWDFASYDPRMKKNKLHVITLDRDDKYMAKFDEASETFSADMAALMEKVEIKYGEQWSDLAGFYRSELDKVAKLTEGLSKIKL